MTSPFDPHTTTFSHINGSPADILDRVAVTELCKGWPVYRDASEWKNYRSLFAPVATVWTTWSGPLAIDDFIEISKKGKAKGVFIQHRECGTLAELGPVLSGPAAVPVTDVPEGAIVRRGIGKMKATITQRFTDDRGVEFDVDCDCRFIFFVEKIAAAGQDTFWRTNYVKLIYEKDHIAPADGATAPIITDEERAYMRDKLPEGYKYLGIMQRRLGYPIDLHLATPRNAGWERMYAAMETWLSGATVALEWESRYGQENDTALPVSQTAAAA